MQLTCTCNQQREIPQLSIPMFHHYVTFFITKNLSFPWLKITYTCHPKEHKSQLWCNIKKIYVVSRSYHLLHAINVTFLNPTTIFDIALYLSHHLDCVGLLGCSMLVLHSSSESSSLDCLVEGKKKLHWEILSSMVSFLWGHNSWRWDTFNLGEIPSSMWKLFIELHFPISEGPLLLL